MKYAANIAGGLLGFLFIAAGAVYLLQIGPTPPPPAPGTPGAHFRAAFEPTGYLSMVKAFEIVGGLLVAIPRLRNLGLLVLGPIILNILAHNAFVLGGEELFDPVMMAIVAMALFLLWTARREFAGLVPPRQPKA